MLMINHNKNLLSMNCIERGTNPHKYFINCRNSRIGRGCLDNTYLVNEVSAHVQLKKLLILGINFKVLLI